MAWRPPGGMKCSPRSAGRGRRIENGAPESPRQVWRRARGTWDCRYEHEPQLRLYVGSSEPAQFIEKVRDIVGLYLDRGRKP
jgi:hypothetical protein